MSQFDDILLFCEDKANGRTVRLLEVAVQALRHDIPIAWRVDPRPVGAKSDVKTRVRFANSDGDRAFGVRDRDFLERSVLDDHRRRALTRTPSEAWPLRRHCIESYLLEPAFLAEILAGRTTAEWHALLEELAATQRWLDLTRAALSDARWQMTRLDWPSVGLSVSSREEAFAQISTQCGEMSEVAGRALNEFSVRSKLDVLERDFADDGPLAHRVDGKKLLTALGARLNAEGHEPKGGLLPALMSYAERHRCPEPLLEEVRELLKGIDAVESDKPAKGEKNAPAKK